jgi:hypothetical protein
MSVDTRFSSHAKRVTDEAVSGAYATLAACERAPFADLLAALRTRATVRSSPAVVRVARNVARFAGWYVRPLSSWRGAEGTIYPVVHSLAQHLLARHQVPRFLASAWYGGESAGDVAKRRWFIAHAAGKPFRELDLPLPMTRRMESIFLGSPDHLGVEAALRRAEILSLGGKEALVNAVLATRLGADLDNGTFWRTVMEFFVRLSDGLDPPAVGPIVDFLQAVRHERVEVVTEDGVRLVDPPEPRFSIKGRTLASVQRLVEAWHRKLGAGPTGALAWSRSRLRPLAFEEPPREIDDPPVRWEIVELTSSAALVREGYVLRHCVASYARQCLWGFSRIWSLRRIESPSQVARSVVTIEVDPHARAIVQARGFRNGAPSPQARRLMTLWARRESLTIRAQV